MPWLRLLSIAALCLAAPAGVSAACEDSGLPGQSIASSLPRCGDPFGNRRALHQRGIDYTLIFTNDLLSNISGGTKTGTVNQSKLEWIFDADLEKLWGFQGLKFHTNGFYLHNTGRIRRDYVGGINTIAAIEAEPSLRLDEFWLEQEFAGGRGSFRFGQITADTEFFFSRTSVFFLNSDWPTIAALNLPSGGPAYPLQTPGVRFRLDPTSQHSFLLAVFNGDPAGPGSGDEQLRNRHGLNFRLGDPPFVIGEAQYRFNQGKNDSGLAGSIKLGAWYHFGRFDDRRFSTDGLSLADPGSNGIPIRYRGNSGVYGVIDQQIYRPRGGNADSGISVFARVSGSPDDRNPISFYADGGIVFAGMIPARPNDSFGATVLHARFSDRMRAFDRDGIIFTGTGIVRDYETNLEISYKAQIAPGWNFQPTVQYIWHPGGGRSRDATVIGARTTIQY